MGMLIVYIHPYMDGNGRNERFLMNVKMAAGGYPWIVIPVNERTSYMTALERACVGADIVPFTKFLAGLTRHRLAGDPPPNVPSSSRESNPCTRRTGRLRPGDWYLTRLEVCVRITTISPL